MTKILILSTSTGYGHDQAANSFKEILLAENNQVLVYDFLKSNKIINGSIVNGYELCANSLRLLYGIGYKLTNNSFINKLNSIIFSSICKSLLKVIDSYKPELIITTHPLCVSILSKLKKKNFISLPIISVVTDFKAHYTYISQEVDAYITASEFTKKHMIAKGINKNKIFSLGIPLRKEFYNLDKATKICSANKYFNILLMGGGMGLNNISCVLEEILKNENNLNITVICGNNKDLKNHLEKTYSKIHKNKIINLVGYTTEISRIMRESDLLISKPGGLTSSEALITALPMLVPFIIPGQETENIQFLSENNCAIYIKSLKHINRKITHLIKNPNILKNMKLSAIELTKNYSKESILKLCNNILSNK